MPPDPVPGELEFGFPEPGGPKLGIPWETAAFQGESPAPAPVPVPKEWPLPSPGPTPGGAPAVFGSMFSDSLFSVRPTHLKDMLLHDWRSSRKRKIEDLLDALEQAIQDELHEVIIRVIWEANNNPSHHAPFSTWTKKLWDMIHLLNEKIDLYNDLIFALEGEGSVTDPGFDEEDGFPGKGGKKWFKQWYKYGEWMGAGYWEKRVGGPIGRAVAFLRRYFLTKGRKPLRSAKKRPVWYEFTHFPHPWNAVWMLLDNVMPVIGGPVPGPK